MIITVLVLFIVGNIVCAGINFAAFLHSGSRFSLTACLINVVACLYIISVARSLA